MRRYVLAAHLDFYYPGDGQFNGENPEQLTPSSKDIAPMMAENLRAYFGDCAVHVFCSDDAPSLQTAEIVNRVMGNAADVEVLEALSSARSYFYSPWIGDNLPSDVFNAVCISTQPNIAHYARASISHEKFQKTMPKTWGAGLSFSFGDGRRAFGGAATGWPSDKVLAYEVVEGPRF